MSQTQHADTANDQHAASIILIVEDDPDFGDILLQTLEEEIGCQVILVPNGKEALQMIQVITPHLFLLDYLLPGMTGLQVYDQVHAIPRLEQTPVLLMSANMPQQEQLERRQLNGLQKPFDLDVLLSKVTALLP